MIKYILMDIEGTTTAISFVHDVLFPYFLDNIQELQKHLEDSFVQEQLTNVKETVQEEENKTINNLEAIDWLTHWTKTDRKHPALKNLQGFLWKNGYLNGQLKGHLYDDVPSMLQKWKDADILLGIYSSGSVAAQKLLFGYSVFGDLTPFFSNYFDTNVGHKREVTAYQNIQKELGIPAQDILFLSDVVEELDAAKTAGFQTIQSVRPDIKAGDKHPIVHNFKEIDLEQA